MKLLRDLLESYRFALGFVIVLLMLIYAGLSLISPYDPTLWGEVQRCAPICRYWLGTVHRQASFQIATFTVRNFRCARADRELSRASLRSRWAWCRATWAAAIGC
ncbi:MAG: hypothetical protein R2932_39880 [Caldilineaceae bacterium]